MKRSNKMKEKTVYQNLTSFFDTLNDVSRGGATHLSSSDLEEYKTRADYERAKLQKQQRHYLKNMARRATTSMSWVNQSNQAERYPALADYELMSRHEIIARALEIYTEETVNKNNSDSAINIYSKNLKIKKELDRLFFDILKIETVLHKIVYNTIKDGDSYYFLDIDEESGITGWKQLPTIMTDRIEGDNIYSNLYNLEEGETKFILRGDHITDFPYWSVANFRLLLDDLKRPYGTSILEKVRRVYKNYELVEDSVMANHLLRGIDRLVHYVNVKNLGADIDVDDYLNEYEEALKRKLSVDPETGQVSLKMSVLSIDQDIIIPIRGNDDGTKIDKIEGQTEIQTSLLEHLLSKMLAALGIRFPYLNFKESLTEGKSLSSQDLHFANTIRRIQQCIIMELNKIAMVHLIAIGMEEDSGDFQITMNNPSMQTQILEIEIMSSKVSLYHDLIDRNPGLQAMSSTRAKKLLFNMTDDEIQKDLELIRIESAAILELEKTNEKIPESGVFKSVDNLYGSTEPVPNSDEELELDLGGGGGGGGGMDMGGLEGLDMGGEEMAGGGFEDVGAEEGPPAEEDMEEPES
jgi:hypothetical protein